jgi:hypothetical protein
MDHTDLARYMTDNFPKMLTLVDTKKRSSLHYAAVAPDGGKCYKMLAVAEGIDTTLKDEVI